MNGDYVTGLFHGMFEGNILTFNPGWDQDGNLLDAYTGVRELQQELRDGEVACCVTRTEAKS